MSLDEFPEFDARSLEVLRQPMDLRQTGYDPLRGAAGSLTFPAAFMLVAAMRYARARAAYSRTRGYGDLIKPCTCSQAMRYAAVTSTRYPARCSTASTRHRRFGGVARRL